MSAPAPAPAPVQTTSLDQSLVSVLSETNEPLPFSLPHLSKFRSNSILVRGEPDSQIVLIKRATGKEAFEVLEKRILSIGLMALFFGKTPPTAATPLPPPGEGASSANVASNEAVATRTSNVPRNIPNPPALPDCWPPSFVYESVSLAGTRVSSAQGIASLAADGQTTTASGPKTKQVPMDRQCGQAFSVDA